MLTIRLARDPRTNAISTTREPLSISPSRLPQFLLRFVRTALSLGKPRNSYMLVTTRQEQTKLNLFLKPPAAEHPKLSPRHTS